MMSYSNKYDALPICRTHARSLCEHPKFRRVRATSDNFVARVVACCHIYFNILSYLLEYVVISIGICCHIYWNMLSYLLEYVVISIGICCHINWNI